MKVINVSDWDANMNDMLRGRNEHEIYDMGYIDALDQIDDWVDAQPFFVLDDLRPKGRWIHKRSPYDSHIYICSNCKEQISILGNKLPSCPYCIADMRGG